MEEKHWESKSYLSFLSSDPLFSSIITIYTLILLYFPHIFLRIIFSPVLISTGILLLILLRLGAIQRTEEPEDDFIEPQQQQSESTGENHKWVESKTEIQAEIKLGFNSNPLFIDSFVEWNVRAPLEVIYEAYEGDGEDHEQEQDDETQTQFMGSERLDRYPSLSLYYPESDTETSSDGEYPYTGEWDSPEKTSFRWGKEEEEREELIEIALDDDDDDDDDGRRSSDFDEDNMIEIDVSPASKH